MRHPDTTSNSGHTTKTCGRCYIRIVTSKFTKDDRICDECIEFAKKHSRPKAKKQKRIEEGFDDWLGGNSVYL